MDEIKVGVATTLTAPVGASNIKIYHEWENEIVVDANASTDYTFTPDSIGVHKVVWVDADGIQLAKEFYSVITPLIDSDTFFAARPELSAFSDQFSERERITRMKIENYTNQRFGPYIDKSLTIQGDDGDTLVLPMRVITLTSVVDNYGEDLTSLVMVGPNNDEILQYRPAFRGAGWEYDTKRDISWNGHELFSHRKDFLITGNWGWEYVPTEVAQAATILLEDDLSGSEATSLRQQGVQEAQLGDFRLKIDGDKWGTTGNATADTLLGGFISYGIELI